MGGASLPVGLIKGATQKKKKTPCHKLNPMIWYFFAHNFK